MSGVLSINGSVIVAASDDSTDFAPYLGLDQKLGIERHSIVSLELDTDDPAEVAMHGMEAHVVIAIANRQVAMLVTSDEGDDQAVPCDPMAILISESAPISALKFTRVAGEATSVKLFIAQKS